MIFSKIHDWQGNPSVKQICVFSCEDAKEKFDTILSKRVYVSGISEANDNGIGAVYKIKAVRHIDNNWSWVIRCGYTSCIIANDDNTYTSYKAAFEAAFKELQLLISSRLTLENFKELFENGF